MIKVQQATPQDLSELQLLLTQANDYSSQLSTRPSWENVEKANTAIKQELQLGNVFVIRGENGNITSTITISETSTLWGELEKDGKALYFMKLMKNPEKAQSNEPKAILTYAVKEVKNRNKTYLRCDAASDHQGLISYYNKLGFTEQGRFLYKPDRTGILLEVSAPLLLINLEKHSPK